MPKIIPVVPLLLLIFLIGFCPFFTALGESFFHDSYGEKTFAGWTNFQFILKDSAFPFSLNITVLWALLNSVLSLILGFHLALRLVSPIARKSYLYLSLLIPWGIPVYIAVPLWRAFLHGNGGESVITRFTGIQFNLMIDPAAGFIGALLVSLWLTVPLSAFVLAGHLRKISHQVLEAARLDGASEGEIARHIYLPSIRESILAIGLLNFIKGFKEFTLVFLLTAGGPPLISGITERHIVGATTTIGIFLYEIFLQTGDWGINAAYAIIMAVLVLFVSSIWILLKKGNALRPLLFLTALSLLPGSVPALRLLGAVYLILAAERKSRFGSQFPERKYQVLGLTVLLHLGFTIFRLAMLGFLRGFNPGVLLAVLCLFLSKSGHTTEVRRERFPIHQPFPGRGYSAVPRITAGCFIALTVIILYMLFWMSLSRISACYMDSLLPPYPTIDNFKIIFLKEGILRYFGNTLVIAGITALLLPLLIFPGAVRLNRSGRRKTLLFLGFIQLLDIAGGMHTLIPLYSIFRQTGLLNTYVPLILIYLYHAVPFSLFILSAYLEGLPDSYQDLAKLEGMGDMAYGFRILLPLSLPPLVTAMMTAFIAGWNGFQAPLLFLNDERLYPISLKLYGYVGNLGSGSPVWNLFAAASVINTLFIGLIFLKFKSPMGHSPLSESTD